MLRRDYILRLIERFGRVLLALRDRILRREIQAPTARAEIQEIAREAGLDLDLARHLDPAMLLMWVSPTGEVDEARFWLLAELLYLEAMAGHHGAVEDGGRPDARRALALYRKLPPDWRPAPDMASPAERIVELEAVVNGGG